MFKPTHEDTEVGRPAQLGSPRAYAQSQRASLASCLWTWARAAPGPPSRRSRTFKGRFKFLVMNVKDPPPGKKKEVIFVGGGGQIHTPMFHHYIYDVQQNILERVIQNRKSIRYVPRCSPSWWIVIGCSKISTQQKIEHTEMLRCSFTNCWRMFQELSNSGILDDEKKCSWDSRAERFEKQAQAHV